MLTKHNFVTGVWLMEQVIVSKIMLNFTIVVVVVVVVCVCVGGGIDMPPRP